MNSSVLFGNNTNNWDLVKQEPVREDVMYTFRKSDGDTVKTFLFAEGTDGSFDMLEYEKHYSCNGGDICYLQMSGTDTLFFYSEPPGARRPSVVGEYAYNFRTMDLDSAKRAFYLEHQDSLRKVRGSGLPLVN